MIVICTIYLVLTHSFKIYFILDVFYKEPQPNKEEFDKRGYCGVAEGSTWIKHENCKCTTNADSFYELEMPNFCKLLCNMQVECKGYSWTMFNICHYYTTSPQCETGLLGSHDNFNCVKADVGKTGTIVNVDEGWIGNNQERGCYIKSPINYFND